VDRYEAGPAPARAVLAIGPEGGWTAGERETLAARGFRALTLGSVTLRADAAALVALSVLRAWWRDL
jgi:16S rRNA (uracil1498-N3)-methyltransferase